MKLKVKFPKEIEEKYNKIDHKFDKLTEKWYKGDVEYQDIIPKDEKFYEEIVNFILDTLNYLINNYEKLDIKEYDYFFGDFCANFYYGPQGDDYNYLDFEVLENREYITIRCRELAPYSKNTLTKKQFLIAKKKFLDLLEKL